MMALTARTSWAYLLLVLAAGTVHADPEAATNPPADPAGAGAAAVDQRLEKLTSKMSQARTLLSQQQTSALTIDLQKSILADLDELLKSPPSSSPPQPPSGSGGSSSPQSSQSKSSSSPSPKSAPMPMPNSETGSETPAAETAGNRRDRDAADDSEERSDQRQPTAVKTLPRKRLEVDVWGHLPEKVREKLLSAYGERMVPQYEDLVQRFYRSLADSAEPAERPGQR